MLIGIIGAPNKGKSTLFSAMTAKDVAIADYPFACSFVVSFIVLKSLAPGI